MCKTMVSRSFRSTCIFTTIYTYELGKISKIDTSNSDLDYFVTEIKLSVVCTDECIVKEDDVCDFNIMDAGMHTSSQRMMIIDIKMNKIQENESLVTTMKRSQ